MPNKMNGVKRQWKLGSQSLVNDFLGPADDFAAAFVCPFHTFPSFLRNPFGSGPYLRSDPFAATVYATYRSRFTFLFDSNLGLSGEWIAG